MPIRILNWNLMTDTKQPFKINRLNTGTYHTQGVIQIDVQHVLNMKRRNETETIILLKAL